MAWKKNDALRVKIYEFICTYASEKRGPTPNVSEIAKNLHLSWCTANYHVGQLAARRLLSVDNGKIIVEGSIWLRPEEVFGTERHIQ